MKQKPAYSTNRRQELDTGFKRPVGDAYTQGKGPIRLRLEKKGRGGKCVTLLTDLPFDESKAKELQKKLQTRFSCGGTLKNSAIELQGDFKEKIGEVLTDLGHLWKWSGG